MKIFPEKYRDNVFPNQRPNTSIERKIPQSQKAENKRLKSKYDYSSQIQALPGSARRPVEAENIVGYNKPRNGVGTTCYSYRYNQIYSTKIACLPGGKKSEDPKPVNKKMHTDETRKRFYENSKNPCYTKKYNDFDNTFRTEAGLKQYKKVGYPIRNQIYGESPKVDFNTTFSRRKYDGLFRNEFGIKQYKRVGYPLREKLYHEKHHQENLLTDYNLYKNESNFDIM